jgi:hypothetical protein
MLTTSANVSEDTVIIATLDEQIVSHCPTERELGLSTTVLQKIRSGQQEDIKLSNFKNIAEACGYSLFLEKGEERIAI